MLASDISAEVSETKNISKSGSFVNLVQSDLEQQSDDDSTLPLVLSSLRSAQLSPPLRKVIAKLLPFLTYGQVSQSKELARYFARYVKLEFLGDVDQLHSHDSILMNTFVETAINLPPVGVCDNLRQELIGNGFVGNIRSFVMRGAPLQPPPWSPALYAKDSKQSTKASEASMRKLKEDWRQYFNRSGLIEAIKILTGLCARHSSTQTLLSGIQNSEKMTIDGEEDEPNVDLDFLNVCHWVESTSDNEASGITTNGLGILAETLLDALKEDNDVATDKIDSIRKKTRLRKKEIAEERRNKALVGMSAFGTLAGSAVADSTAASHASGGAESSDNRSTSMLASMFGMSAFSSSKARGATKEADKDADEKKPQPSWMAEVSFCHSVYVFHRCSFILPRLFPTDGSNG